MTADRHADVHGDAIGNAASESTGDALIVFARAPEAGRVKTRLAASVGPERALAVYRELAERVAESVAPRAPGEPYDATVCFTPDGAGAEMRRWLGERFAYEAQLEGDLGERMAGAITRRFAVGARRVVVVGTDCPGVTAEVVAAAFAWLAHVDVVFGPALDGGYYLVGVRRRAPLPFDGVPWSSERTLDVSLARARAAGLTVALLEPLRDVDTLDDLEAWRREAGVAHPPAR